MSASWTAIPKATLRTRRIPRRISRLPRLTPPIPPRLLSRGIRRRTFSPTNRNRRQGSETRMAKQEYATSPPNISGMPPGVPYIIGNEGAERFSFYGMRTILIGFMTQFMVNRSGILQGMPENEAQGWFHQFVSSVYWMPFFGAIIADGWLGKYKTIFSLSIVYCLGQFTLALMDTSFGVHFGQKWVLAIGLVLVAAGAGGIKPCVSANVGDQF